MCTSLTTAFATSTNTIKRIGSVRSDLSWWWRRRRRWQLQLCSNVRLHVWLKKANEISNQLIEHWKCNGNNNSKITNNTTMRHIQQVVPCELMQYSNWFSQNHFHVCTFDRFTLRWINVWSKHCRRRCCCCSRLFFGGNAKRLSRRKTNSMPCRSVDILDVVAIRDCKAKIRNKTEKSLSCRPKLLMDRTNEKVIIWKITHVFDAHKNCDSIEKKKYWAVLNYIVRRANNSFWMCSQRVIMKPCAGSIIHHEYACKRNTESVCKSRLIPVFVALKATEEEREKKKQHHIRMGREKKNRRIDSSRLGLDL